MELTVLVDNNSLIDRYLLAEPGLSLHLRLPGGDMLFDCGYSGVLRTNAARLDIDLARLSTVVLSHGHLDHTWGLAHLLALGAERATEGHPPPRPRLVAHPEALAPRFADGLAIGVQHSREVLADHFDLILSRAPLALADRLHFLGQIPRRPEFGQTRPIGERRAPCGPVPDTLPDDTALAYRGRDGLVVIVGCAHAGLANTVEHAREVTGESRVAAVIGGLHLLGESPDGLDEAVRYLAQVKPAALYPCHCTSLAAKIALAGVAPVREVGTGLRLTLD